MRESQRILQENTGNPWNWKQCSDRKLSGFFPVDSCQLPVRFDRNRPEIIGKVRKISGRTIASMFHRFPVFFGRNWSVLIDLGHGTFMHYSS
jgi:hypothetical protein